VLKRIFWAYCAQCMTTLSIIKFCQLISLRIVKIAIWIFCFYGWNTVKHIAPPSKMYIFICWITRRKIKILIIVIGKQHAEETWHWNIKKNVTTLLVKCCGTTLRSAKRSFLHCALASCGAAYCNRSCLFVCGWVCVFVGESVTTITRNCMHRYSPNWVCR